jgi:TonB family protein
MENDFKAFLIVSFIIHAGLFAAFSLQPSRTSYIVLPIDLLLNSPVQETNISNAVQPAGKPVELKKQKEKEIVIPKKQKKVLKAAPKKEEQKEEPKPQAQPQPQTPAQPKAQASGYSGSISVDTARFPYAYYTNTIVRKIGRYWQWSNEFGRLKSVVFFRITKDGSVPEVSLKDSSGDNLFDEQAVRAVKLASPFPPLPDGYPDNDLGVYFEFSYKE